MFHNFSYDKPVIIKIDGVTVEFNRIVYPLREATSVSAFSNLSGSNTESIAVKVSKGGQAISNYTFEILLNTLKREGNIKSESLIRCEYLSQRVANQVNFLQTFSEIDKNDGLGELIDCIKVFDNSINGLSLSMVGFATELFASSTKFNQKVPLALLGEGLTKFVWILCSILARKNSVILIDELENGFHFSLFEKIWAVLTEKAIKYNQQIFITTHSYELLRAAKEQATAHKSEYSLHRLLSQDTVKSLTGDQMLSALDEEWEVR